MAGEVELGLQVGAAVGVEAVANDAMLQRVAAGGERGLNGAGDGGGDRLVIAAVREAGEGGQAGGALEKRGVEAGDEDEADSGHGDLLLRRGDSNGLRPAVTANPQIFHDSVRREPRSFGKNHAFLVFPLDTLHAADLSGDDVEFQDARRDITRINFHAKIVVVRVPDLLA
jgi:hypothetical protein